MKEDKIRRSIELLLGPYRSGKTRALLKRVVEHCLAKPAEGATIVVPSARYRELLEGRLAELRHEPVGSEDAPTMKGFVGLKILTFYQYCERLLKQCGSFNRIVPDTIRPSLIGLVLSKLKKDGQIQSIEPIVDFPGTAAAVLTLVDELQRSGMSPEGIMQRLEATVGKHSRHMELARVYQNYWNSLDAIGYLDRRRLAYKLLETLTEPGNKIAGRLGLLAFDGFDRFNSLQLHVIAALAEHVKLLLLSFDYLEPEADRNSEYIWKQPSYDELQSILGARLQTTTYGVVANSGAAALNAVSLEGFSAPDRYFEMAEVAARIKRALKMGASDLNNFLVVARSLDKYKSAVEAAFSDAGVDHFMDEPIELAALPVVRYLLKITSLHLNGFMRADVVDTLRSSYFKRGAFFLSEEAISDLDRCSRERAVLGGIEQWQAALIDSTRQDLWQRLEAVFDVLSAPKSRGTTTEYVHWLEDLIERLLILPSEDEFFDPFEQWEQDRALAQFRDVLALLVGEQEIVSRLSHQNEISYADFCARLHRLVERSNFQREPRTKNYVLVCAAEMAPNKRYEQIFIAGLTEGEFPKQKRGTGFVNNEEVDAWRRFGIDIHNPRLSPSFEPALFQSLIQRAKQRVVLSCPLAEMSGEELTPSSLLQGIDYSDVGEIPFVHALYGMSSRPNSVRNAVAAHFWNASERELPAPFFAHSALADLIHNLEEPLAMARSRTAQSGVGPLNGSLVDYVSTGAAVIPLPKYWSPTGLSDYGKCPFRFWLSHVLKVESPQEPEEGLSPRLLGLIYHKALELFYKRLLLENLDIKDLNDERLSSILDEVGKEAIALLGDQPDFHKDEFWHYRYQEILFRLRRLLKEERARAFKSGEQFTPRFLEVSFGFEKEGSYPPLRIAQGESEVFIRGIVDRVDIASGSDLGSASRLRVVDYKSGSTPISYADARAGRNLQLPLYVLAVEDVILPKGKVVEAEYLSVASALPFGKLQFENPRTTEATDELMKETEANVLRFVSGIKRGDFSVRPSSTKVCRTCDHRTICRVSELSTSSENQPENEY